MRRRTRALLELAVGVLTLGFVFRLRGYLRRHEEADDPVPLSASALAAGALSRAVRLALYDRDVGGIRTSRRRGFLFGCCELGWQFLLRRRASDPETFSYGYRTGTAVGTVGYRLRYGLLRPLPGDGE